MADRTITERLQPSLLDRLTDLEPDQKTEQREARVIDIRRLREIIVRDLSWLLNTNNNDMVFDEGLYPHVSRSVLNFGVREVAGDYASAQRANAMRASIQRALEYFEPRVKKGTLNVVLQVEEKASKTVIVFDIHADMWAQPLPMELYLRSEVDVTTGDTRVERKV